MPATWIQHVNLSVDDLAAAVGFYTEVVGLVLAPTPDLPFPAQFVAINDDQEIHLNEVGDRAGERSHFCLRVDDFAGVFRRAKAAGAIDTVTNGQARRLPSGTLQLFVRDPTGNLVEIACDADQPVDPAVLADECFVAGTS